MLRVSEKWQGSDVGRQRTGNEDSLFVQAPLFVLADGMGGAQAGEVASEIAIEAFRAALPADTDSLVATIEQANARVHDESERTPEYHGMGTTCTVAYVAADEVLIAHVGDSRAYLLRDGELTRVTVDHSLVGELVARGKVSEEEALTHPQRSVITRAVGPEPSVKVDAERIAARGDDVFLLCSDGLTDMVRDRDVNRILNAVPTLEQAGRNLIAAANAAGGRDNITVILFRLEELDGDGAVVGAGGSALDADRQITTTSHAVVDEGPTSAPPPRTVPPPRRPASEPEPAKGWRRVIKPLIVIFILLALFGTAGFIAMRGVFFVGLDDNRSVTIYRGLPYDVGVKLYTRNYTSGVRIDQVPEERRKTFTDHKLRSLDDANDLVRQLETGTVK